MALDLSKVAAQGEIPEGEYKARVLDVEVKGTKAGTGKYLKVKFVLEEAGAHIFEMFNLENPNPEAVKIGLGKLKALLKASGYPNPDLLSDFHELCGLRCLARIKNKTDSYGTKATISSFKSLSADNPSGEDVGNIPSF